MSEETNEPTAKVTLNDFIVMVRVIDICSKRGAFEGAELKDVGTLRGRLADFIEANRPPEEEEASEEASEEEAGAPEEEAE